MKKAFNIISIIVSGIVLILITGFNLYAFALNETNHTGFDTYILIKIYIVIFLLWLFLFIYFKRKGLEYNRVILILIFLIFMAAVLTVVIYEKFNILMYYETWIEKGMPEKFDQGLLFF